MKESQRRKHRPDPVVDTIISNEYDRDQGKQVETSGLVTLMVPINPNDPRGDMPIELNHNGKNFTLPRGKMATIPRELAEVLKNAASSRSMVPKLGKTRHDSSGNLIGTMEEEINERFQVIIERED